MGRPFLYVDFNEMLEADLVLLSATDTKPDVNGIEVVLNEGLEIDVCMDDSDASGRADNLVARGVVERNRVAGWGAHVKWCCRIDASGIKHQSEL